MNVEAAEVGQTSLSPAEIGDRLRRAGLLRERSYIDGDWIDAGKEQVVEVHNPSTGKLIGRVPALGVDLARRAIDAAQSAFGSWRALLPQQRQKYLAAWHAEILAHREELAQLLTLEQGKPLAQARGEIDYGASFVEWFAEEAKRAYGDTIPSHLPGRHMLSYRQPIGVAGLMIPWNFPSAMMARKASAALAAGCTVVAYQSSWTPFSALALADLAQRAGIPRGVFNVLTGRSRALVTELCMHPKVRVVSFTGSTEVGRALLEKCASTVKRTCMELGGNAPFIAFPDVPVPTLVDAAIAAKYSASGQDCLAANRMYIHRDIYSAFVQKYAEAVQALPVGDGFESGVVIGPLQHSGQVRKSEEHVSDAIAKGARLVTGGRMHSRGGLFYLPTVLADVRPDMKIYHEENFGPVSAVIPFADESGVIQMANDSEYGLAAYVYCRDHGTCLRFSQALEYGMVAVNSVKMTGPPIPFGGIKQSGFGKEGSRHGIEEFTDLRYVCFGVEAT